MLGFQIIIVVGCVGILAIMWIQAIRAARRHRDDDK